MDKPNKINEFTFCVLAYNEEEYIIECLESIKYQITNFSKNKYTISLIIVDDASTDNTSIYINKWIKLNKSLFNSIDFHINNRNAGVVSGYCYIIKNLKTDYFKVIAGDDVFSSENIFKNYYKIKNNEMIISSVLTLQNKKIILRNDDISRYAYYEKRTKKIKKLYKLLASYCFIPAPECIYSRNLIKNIDIDNINNNFKYIEDYPTWYQILKNNKKVEISYNIKPQVLYRINDKSIYATKPKGYFKDLITIKKILKNNTNILFKIALTNEINNYEKENESINKYLSITSYILKISHSILYKKKLNAYLNILKKVTEKEQNHYNLINNRAKEFLTYEK